MDALIGHVERITFYNKENGYTIAHLKIKDASDLVCIVGTFPKISPGEKMRCMGQWKNHLIYGRQFEVSSFEIQAPADVAGIEKYLSSGLIKGIGSTYAKRIIEKFGENTLDIIDHEPDRLSEVPGLGKKKIESIKTSWNEQRSVRDVMIFLRGHGITPVFAQKIFKAYGKESVKKIQENPYQMAQDIFGIGFKTADQIAANLGIEKDSPLRIESGIEHVLKELSNDGHVCYPIEEFLVEAEKILEVSKELIEAQLKPLEEKARIKIDSLIFYHTPSQFIWLKSLYYSEKGIARDLKRLKESSLFLRKIDVDKAVAWAEKKLGIQLAEKQKKAIETAISHKLNIITGGPGTGKSTITRAILLIMEQLTQNIVLAAPTGKAAKRMSEITHKKAVTIHSLLEYDFSGKGFKKNRDNPLLCDLIIIDEASMIDTLLMYHLLKAIPSHACVVFLGDIDQLPSVGPGNVLKDLIQSYSFSVTQLTEIFRQANGSQIILNAHQVNKGHFPYLDNKRDSDFFFLESQEPEEILNHIVKLVGQRLPSHYGFNPVVDIQVLAPMRKGCIGVDNLNRELQKFLNPQEKALQKGVFQFRQHDKVMQIRNNYKKNVFNGDMGTILGIDEEEEKVDIQFDEKTIAYSFAELNEIVLAYAISIHKFQGSEAPCIVLPIHTSHYMMLQRNLLYTGITRAKKLLVIVGTKKALMLAVKNDQIQRRYTSLKQSIMELL